MSKTCISSFARVAAASALFAVAQICDAAQPDKAKVEVGNGTAVKDRAFESADAARKSGKIMKPGRVERDGDYEIQHYSLTAGGLVELRMRGVYRVHKVTKDGVELVPLPGQKGLLPGPWLVTAGETAIGNRHYLKVSGLDDAKQTVTLTPRYKVKHHWWDALNF